MHRYIPFSAIRCMVEAYGRPAASGRDIRPHLVRSELGSNVAEQASQVGFLPNPAPLNGLLVLGKVC